MTLGGGLGTLRAALVGALVAVPLAVPGAAPLAADSLPGVPGVPGMIATAALLLAPDAPSYDAARRAQLARNVLDFVPGDDESFDDDGVFSLPAPLPWPPGAGARDYTLTVPPARPLFLLAALAPANVGFGGTPGVTLDGASLGNVLAYAVRGVPVSDGAQQQDHAALALVMAAPPPGRHTLEVSCGACAPTKGPWLSQVNGGKRTYTLNVEALPSIVAPAPPSSVSAEPRDTGGVEVRTMAFMEANIGIGVGPGVGPGAVVLPAPGDAAPGAVPVPLLPLIAAPAPAGTPEVAPTSRVLERRLYSDALGRELPYRIYLPAGYTPGTPAANVEGPRRYPVLYLLHGLGSGFRHWSRLGLEAELDRQNVQAIVVTPSGRAGYWVNHADGGPRWADYVVDDVIKHIDATYRTIPTREARAIGGISMGGHGALQIALNNPTLFGAIGAHSPALRPRDQAPVFLGGVLMAASPTSMPPQAYAARDPISLVDRAQQKVPVWIDAGDADRWRPRAEELRAALRAKGWDVVWAPAPGDHEPDYWTRRLPDYVAWYKARLAA